MNTKAASAKMMDYHAHHPLFIIPNLVVAALMGSAPWWIEFAVQAQPVVTLFGATAGLVYVGMQVINLAASWFRYGVGAKPHDSQHSDSHES